MGGSNVKGRTYAELKTDLSLNSVENTALSTWAGTSNITTLGTIVSGTIPTSVITNLSGTNTGDQTTISGNAGSATVATTVTITDNEDTAEANKLIFAAGAAVSGDLGLEADGDLTYNPSTGELESTKLKTETVTLASGAAYPWVIEREGTTAIRIKINDVVYFELDTSGNLSVKGNITAYKSF